MVFVLKIERRLQSQGWKVKITNKECLETPHVTIIFKTTKWRINLRTRKFMDKKPPPRDVPKEIFDEVMQHTADLIQAWDNMYPLNLVDSEN